jgi:hypothetical protein
MKFQCGGLKGRWLMGELIYRVFMEYNLPSSAGMLPEREFELRSLQKDVISSLKSAKNDLKNKESHSSRISVSDRFWGIEWFSRFWFRYLSKSSC